MTNICPACERGVLSPTVTDESLLYSGAKIVVPEIEFSVCNVCGEEVVLPSQARRNDVKFADAKRSHDELLRSHEIVEWRSRWCLTQQQASALLGGGVNAFSKYERGEVIQSRAMDLLIRASDEFSGLLEFLASRAGLQSPDQKWEPVSGAQGDLILEMTMEQVSVKSNVIDLTTYRFEELRGEANDGEWNEEPELNYGG